MKRALFGLALVLAGLAFPKPASAQVVILPVPSYGPLWSGPLVNTVPTWRRNFPGGFNTGLPRGTYAIAGVNSPAIGVRNTGAAPRAKRAPEPKPALDPVEQLIRDRGLVEATVVKVGTAGVTVRLSSKETVRYPVGDVYFFRGDDLLTVRSTPGIIEPGSRVLVPAE